MAEAFEVRRIVEVLIEQEQEGYEFYTEAAKRMDDSKAKKLFEKLAKDELKHKKTYEKMLDKIPADHTVPLENDGIAYLDLLLRQYTLKTAQRVKHSSRNMAKGEALEIAEGLERDTIFFLNEIINTDFILNREEAIHNALKEERMHLTYILETGFNMASASLML